MSDELKPSLTPYWIDAKVDTGGVAVCSGDKNQAIIVALCPREGGEAQAIADARFIATACNFYASEEQRRQYDIK